MLDKKKYIRLLKAWLKENNVPDTMYHISHGGVCLLHGLKKYTEDIDLTVHKDIYQRFLDDPDYEQIELHNPYFRMIPVTEVIDIHDRGWDIPEDQIEFIDGIRCRTLERTLDDYLELNRPKDQIYIAKLKELIKKKQGVR